MTLPKCPDKKAPGFTSCDDIDAADQNTCETYFSQVADGLYRKCKWVSQNCLNAGDWCSTAAAQSFEWKSWELDLVNRKFVGDENTVFSMHAAPKDSPMSKKCALDKFTPGFWKSGGTTHRQVPAEDAWQCSSYSGGTTVHLFWSRVHNSAGFNNYLQPNPLGEGQVKDLYCHTPQTESDAIFMRIPISAAGTYTVDLLGAKYTNSGNTAGRLKVWHEANGVATQMVTKDGMASTTVLPTEAQGNAPVSSAFAQGDAVLIGFSGYFSNAQALVRFRIRSS